MIAIVAFIASLLSCGHFRRHFNPGKHKGHQVSMAASFIR